MKFLLMTLMLSSMTFTSTPTTKGVEKTIKQFVQAGDNQDVKTMNELLHNDYRIVMNQVFGSDQITTVSKEMYLSKLESKEWGGDKRACAIQSIEVNDKNAVATVRLVGEKMTMTSQIVLVQTSTGNWLIIEDIPVIEAK